MRIRNKGGERLLQKGSRYSRRENNEEMNREDELVQKEEGKKRKVQEEKREKYETGKMTEGAKAVITVPHTHGIN